MTPRVQAAKMPLLIQGKSTCMYAAANSLLGITVEVTEGMQLLLVLPIYLVIELLLTEYICNILFLNAMCPVVVSSTRCSVGGCACN